jgi:hypothetical protein
MLSWQTNEALHIERVSSLVHQQQNFLLHNDEFRMSLIVSPDFICPSLQYTSDLETNTIPYLISHGYLVLHKDLLTIQMVMDGLPLFLVSGG